eukprot:664783-Prorocentrum_lima.AAC.1
MSGLSNNGCNHLWGWVEQFVGDGVKAWRTLAALQDVSDVRGETGRVAEREGASLVDVPHQHVLA